nr:RNA-directed DNA polymerase, eukaryota [Tanacetum cinerariifolium]
MAKITTLVLTKKQNLCDLILDVVAAAVVEVEEGRKKVNGLNGRTLSFLLKTVGTLPCWRLQESNGEMYNIWVFERYGTMHCRLMDSRHFMILGKNFMLVVAGVLFGVIQGIFILEFSVLQGSASLVMGCYDLSTGTPCIDGFDVTPLESTVGHIQGVTAGSSLDAIFNHFTGKFNLSPNSQTADKTAEQKEKSCIAVATVANKEVDAYIMVSNQFVQDHFHMPSLVAYDSPELLESSSRRVHTDRLVLNAARNQTTNHAHGTNGERSSSVHTEGILVGDNMSSIKAWDETISKMKKMLSRWKLNTLSVGGRLTLLKLVLGSTP